MDDQGSGQWLDAISVTKQALRTYGGSASVRLAHVLCDRHPPSDTAFRGVGASQIDGMTYGELQENSARFATVLDELGVERGDRVATLLPKGAELIVTMLGIWRLGAVQVPLFTAFGPEAAEFRIRTSGARLLVTDSGNRAKVEPSLAHDLSVVTIGDSEQAPGDVDFWSALSEAAPRTTTVALGADEPFIILYTSGTTGHPKGVVVPVKALASFEAYARIGLDLRRSDVYLNLADTGWGYGLWYGVIAPLLIGQPFLISGRFDADAIYDIVLDQGVTHLAGAATAFRALRAAGVPAGFNRRSGLRALSAAGEPLSPDLLAWSIAVLGLPIRDHYGQSELGMVIGNHHLAAHSVEPRGGSMGECLPGYRMVVLDEAGTEVIGKVGDLCCDVWNSPLYWFCGYHEEPEKTAERFPFGDRYFVTGDLVRQDSDRSFYYSSRADDVITSAGYRIGPYEIEQVLLTHPGVAEVAVVGVPDDLRGEAIAAFIVPTLGHHPDDALLRELQQLVKERLAAHAYPRHVTFLKGLPKTPSGKIRRVDLRRAAP